MSSTQKYSEQHARLTKCMDVDEVEGICKDRSRSATAAGTGKTKYLLHV